MNYLAQLKQLIAQEVPKLAPTKPTEGDEQLPKGACVGFVGTPPAPLQNIFVQRQEFEALLAIVAPAYNTPPHEVEWARETAWGDLDAALVSYREMAAQCRNKRGAKNC